MYIGCYSVLWCQRFPTPFLCQLRSMVDTWGFLFLSVHHILSSHILQMFELINVLDTQNTPMEYFKMVKPQNLIPLNLNTLYNVFN